MEMLSDYNCETDDDSNEVKYIVKKKAVPGDKEEIAHDDTRPNYFNLSENSSSDEDNCNESTYTQSQGTLKSSTSNSVVDNTFWSDKNDSESWDEPDKIWNCCYSGKRTHPVQSTGTSKISSLQESKMTNFKSEHCLKKYEPKNPKCNMPNSFVWQDVKDITSDTMVKSCYNVHHKISPLLDSHSVRCKIPCKISNRITAHSGIVNKIDWCSSQYSHLLLSASMDKFIKIWNIFTMESSCLRTLKHHTRAIKDACWSDNGKQILSCSYDKSAIICDVETGKEVVKCVNEAFVSVGKYHPINHNYFVIGTSNKLICWDSRNTSRPVRNYIYKDTIGQVQDIAFLKGGKEFITCSDLVCRDSADRNIMAWDFEKGVVLSNQIYQERYTCTSLKCHPSEGEFIAQTQGDYIAAFSTIKPYKMNRYKRYEGHKVVGYNVGCDFSPDGRLITSGSSDGHVLFYDYQYARQIHKMNLGRNTICLDVTWHPLLNSTVAVSTWDGSIIILQ